MSFLDIGVFVFLLISLGEASLLVIRGIGFGVGVDLHSQALA
jgi:hypothetical protein